MTEEDLSAYDEYANAAVGYDSEQGESTPVEPEEDEPSVDHEPVVES